MQLHQALIILAYGALAGAAFWRNRLDENRRFVGFALLASWAFSNICWMVLPADVRPVVFSFLEMIVLVAVLLAFMMENKSANLFAIASVSTASMIANLALACALINHDADLGVSTSTHAAISNVCFTLECVLLMFWEVPDRVASLYNRVRGHMRRLGAYAYGLARRKA